ncbi:MAG: DUF3311 domain-containing protein [Defluviitaleaceae bacterium]|nr:DUF3311 domain-containing protein [Defluviitaleaceae bacterium]MCL2263715.1 DUF3311 domain-containing protein [Defluviitaleaceae bacterium]
MIPYQLNKAHLLICIFAGLVLTSGFVWLIFFGVPFQLFRMAMWVSAGIVIFYVIGQFARSILIEKVFMETDEFELPPDEEYPEFMESLHDDAENPSDVMYDDPMNSESMKYDDSLDDPYMEPMPLESAS